MNAMIRALDTAAGQGKMIPFWLRDDDAVTPTPALDALLAVTGPRGVPVTLAVIPQHTGPALAERLDCASGVRVAVHGWSHENHEPAGKKQELGPARPAATVLAELAEGRRKLHALHGARALDLLVPPWNRIAPDVVAGLPGIGFRALSTFGPEGSGALPLIHTHVDPIDWHGSRSLRDPAALWSEAAARVAHVAAEGGTVGLLTHHLVHDGAIQDFIAAFLDATAGHPAARWITPDMAIPALAVSSAGRAA